MPVSKYHHLFLVCALSMLGGTACVSSGASIELLKNPMPMQTAFKENRMRIVSFNLDGQKKDKDARLERAAAEIKLADGDIVVLQDLTQGWSKGNDSRPAIEAIGYAYQANYIFEDKLPMAESSMMILSKWPLERAEAFVFNHNSGQHRSGFVMCDIQAPMGTVTFIFVQISEGEKTAVIEQQIEELRRIMDDKIEPDGFLVVAGNIDIDPDGALMDRMRGAGLAVAGDERGLRQNPSYSGNILTPCNVGVGRRSDYIFFRAPDNDEIQGLREIDSGVNQPEYPYPSSHCPVWADLELK